MAVPFNVPEDQSEADVLIRQIQTLLTKLQIIVRRSQQNQPVPGNSSTTSRERHTRRVRHDNENLNLPNSALPDFTWLSAINQEANSTALSQLTAVAIDGANRRRTISESSCCSEDNKLTVTAILNNTGPTHDWAQVGVALRKIADEFNPSSIQKNKDSKSKELHSGNGLLSKILPESLTSSLWTAMICVVGWHLFRAR